MVQNRVTQPVEVWNEESDDSDVEVIENPQNQAREPWILRDNPKKQIIGYPIAHVMMRWTINLVNNLAFISQVELKLLDEAESDENWIIATQEELNQFERSKV